MPTHFRFIQLLYGSKSYVERPISFLIRDLENQTLVKKEKHERGGGGEKVWGGGGEGC